MDNLFISIVVIRYQLAQKYFLIRFIDLKKLFSYFQVSLRSLPENFSQY